ncbi:MAG: 2-iminoacetate synthase ThiH [Odoribacteraceae bacterium]|jgi:2-iminoacetate synthase|nr:2-iminoacetate synthase ThiH [Odoribacteraceae bacterium]
MFRDVMQQYPWAEVKQRLADQTKQDALAALGRERRTPDDFLALISPAAAPLLEDMAREARRLTLERFGRTIQLYIPLYLSNHCTNFCVYCGFNHDNKFQRKMLTLEEVEAECAVISGWGFRHLLLVSGEAPAKTNADYYERVIRLVRERFSQVSIEVQPLEREEYARLVEAGLDCVCVYQETYNEQRYPLYHPHGRKANYHYRLATPDRAGLAGVHKIGIGALLGLEEWRVDSFFTALHLKYLEKTYWRGKYSISLPRLRPHAGSFVPNDPISDRELVQLICAYRLLDQEVEISISTRESRAFRDHVMLLGATSMSAGSSTEPGGYVSPHAELEQFAINDNRSPQEMVDAIRARGYEPVWKDWDRWMAGAITG